MRSDEEFERPRVGNLKSERYLLNRFAYFARALRNLNALSLRCFVNRV